MDKTENWKVSFFRELSEKTNITVAEISGRDLYNFIKTSPTPETRYAYYRDLIKHDSGTKAGTRSISLMILRSYRGPRLDVTDPTYEPTELFLERIEQILSEIKFGHKLGSIIRNLIRDGVVYYRIHRTTAGKIRRLEYLPADSVTILSDDYLDDEDEDGIITEADYYVLNETNPIKTREDLDNASADPDSPVEVLRGDDVLRIAWEAEDGVAEDKWGRSVVGLLGISPLETTSFFSKIKLAIILDQQRWLHNALPRWFASIDLSSMILPEDQEGPTKEAKMDNAVEKARSLFKEFQRQLYYEDQDETSPTYGQLLPPEPDGIMMHSDGINMEMKGGASLSVDFTSLIETCDRAISSVLSIPMTALGYDRGTTYASARVTESFMAGFGGGLIREVEGALVEFLQSEFTRRAFGAKDRDWENLYFDYLVDDADRNLQNATIDKTIVDKEAVMVQTVQMAWSSGMIPMGEVVKALKKTTLFSDLPSLRPDEADVYYEAPTAGIPFSGASSRHVDTHRPTTPFDVQLEDALKDRSIISDDGDVGIETRIFTEHKEEITDFLEDLARRVENGGVDFGEDAVDVPEPIEKEGFRPEK
jgi:hypothetical protein